MREREIQKAYLGELFAAIGIYAAILVPVMTWGPSMAQGVLRTLVLVSPMLGFLLMLWAIARQFQRVDEFIRRSILENVAIAAAVTAGLTFSYGFLESAGYPRLSMFVVWPVMGGVWFGVGAIRGLLNR
jgi:hypothetical protein